MDVSELDVDELHKKRFATIVSVSVDGSGPLMELATATLHKRFVDPKVHTKIGLVKMQCLLAATVRLPPRIAVDV
jgi:hypothetical protein